MALNAENQITYAVYLDFNTLADVNGKADLLPDVLAINNSLYNLFRCHVGGRGPIFQPQYGTNLMQMIHEPTDMITANKIRILLIQAIQRWEPRIVVDMLRTTVEPVLELPGFAVQVYYTITGLNIQGSTGVLQFTKL